MLKIFWKNCKKSNKYSKIASIEERLTVIIKKIEIKFYILKKKNYY